MVKIITALLLVVLGYGVLGLPVLAADPGGTIEGTIINETTGAPAANQPVTIKKYMNDSELESKSTNTDADGKFSLGSLSAQSDYSYEATINYQGADYVSDRVDFKDGNTTKTVKITVWDSTADESVLKVQSGHTIVYAESGNLLVKQYAVVQNDSNLTYIGSKQLAPDKKETLRLSVPPGATKLEYGSSLMSCCVIPGEGVISDTMPVNPGTREITYQYQIPYKSSTYSFASSFDYPTKNFDLLVQGEGIDVVGTNLPQSYPVTYNEQTFNLFSVPEAAAGDKLNLELSGLPADTSQRYTKLILMSLVAIAVIGLIGYFIRRRQPQPVPAVSGQSTNEGSLQKQLVAQIALLDDRYEAGAVPEDDYNQQRAAKKAELMRLMRSQQRKDRRRHK